ncbi:MAG TPA: GGDEF domain-containing protein [bacterium]|nr:GGDEF domain-containing protein [bacterium]
MVLENLNNLQEDLFQNIEIKDLLNSLDEEAAIVTDNTNKIIFYNNIASIMLMVDLENFLHKHIETVSYFENLLKKCKVPIKIKDLPTGYKVSHIHEMSGKDHYFEHERVDIYDETGKNKGVLYLIRDITKEINVEMLLSVEVKVDGLSGLYNLRSFYEELEKELSRCSRYGYDLSILFIDINNFKFFNDNLGHKAGNEAIKLLSKALIDSVRKNIDTVYRYGGDEFTVILPNTPAKRAAIVANRILSNFKNNLKKDLKFLMSDTSCDLCLENIILDDDNKDFKAIGLSIGVSQYKKGKSANELIVEADKAMYAAKHDLKENTKISF